MGSIFSSKHTFSSLATPVKEAGRMGRTLKSRKRALDAKTEHKIAAKRRAKERVYKQEEKERKAKEKERKKKLKIMTKSEYIKTIPEKEKKEWAREPGGLKQAYRDAYVGYKQRAEKPKYNKWGDRIA